MPRVLLACVLLWAAAATVVLASYRSVNEWTSSTTCAGAPDTVTIYEVTAGSACNPVACAGSGSSSTTTTCATSFTTPTGALFSGAVTYGTSNNCTGTVTRASFFQAGVCVQFGGGSIKWTCGTNTTTGVNHGNNNCAGNGTATTQNLNACSVAGGGGTATYICTGHSAGHALAALPLSMLAVVAAACTSLVAALL